MTVSDAERQINAILAELERSSGANIESLELDEQNITMVVDDCTQFVRTARITLRPPIGTRWNV